MLGPAVVRRRLRREVGVGELHDDLDAVGMIEETGVQVDVLELELPEIVCGYGRPLDWVDAFEPDPVSPPEFAAGLLGAVPAVIVVEFDLVTFGLVWVYRAVFGRASPGALC